MIASQHTDAAAAGRAETGIPSSDVQPLLERIAFLEEQIGELRRAHRADKDRLAPRRAARKNILRRIYFALATEPVIGPVVVRMGRVARVLVS